MMHLLTVRECLLLYRGMTSHAFLEFRPLGIPRGGKDIAQPLFKGSWVRLVDQIKRLTFRYQMARALNKT